MPQQQTKQEQMEENLYNTPHIQPPPMKTFYNKSVPCTPPTHYASANCTPYATTTLMAQSNLLNKPDSAFRPIQTDPYKIQGHGGSYSEKMDNRSVGSNSDNGRPHEFMTDPYTYDNPYEGTPVHSDHYGSNYGTDDRNRFPGGGPQLFLPPPPEHPPPPTDVDSPPDSPSNMRKQNNIQYAMPHGRRPKDITPGGGVPNPNMGSQNRFSPQDNHHNHNTGGGTPDRPPSPKCRTMSPRMMADSRAYSPRAMSEPERGPTPPVRAYKLIPLKGHPEYPRHYSDTEGAPVPPLRMMSSHNPPSPAPDDPLLGERDAESPLDPMMDRAIQSSLPSLASECVRGLDDRGQLEHGQGSTEAVAPDYEEHSDLEGVLNHRGSPTSSAGEGEEQPTNGHSEVLWEILQKHPELLYKHPDLLTKDPDEQGSMLGTWASVTDNSDDNASSKLSTSSDGSFFAEADFASAVAMAAELSGLTVVGSTVMDPNAGKERERQQRRKPAKHRERAKRPSSPYSTDSNYSTVQVPHKPYPKSERKKQLQEHGHSRHKHPHPHPNGHAHGYSSHGHTPSQERRPRPGVRPKPMQNDHGFHGKPSYPYHTDPHGLVAGGHPHSNNNRKHSAGTPKTPTTPNGYHDHRGMPQGHMAPPPTAGGLRTNPLTSAFDTTDVSFKEYTPIV